MSPKLPENTERINVFFSPAVLDRLKQEAAERGMTVSGLIRMIAMEWLKAGNEKTTEWIPTASKMPDRDQNVLVWLYGDYGIGYLDKDPDTREIRWNFEEFDLYGDEMEAVEAWMPLPKAYRGDCRG